MNDSIKKGLGRGLGALLGDEAIRDAGSRSASLRLAEVEPNANQPRKLFDESAIADLADSIRMHGVLTPLIVRRQSSGMYQIIAGERRWRAARMAGLTYLPAIIMDADDRKASELALIENLQREDLTPLEIAEGYKALIDEFDMTQENVAEQVGRSRPSVTNALRLLTLQPAARNLLAEGKLSEGHSRALLALKGKQQEKAAAHVAATGMNVRQTESYVKRIMESGAESSAEAKPNFLEEHEKRLSEQLSRRVRIVAGKSKGKLELEFYGADDLEKLLRLLERI